jgi:LemA protein
VNVSSLVIIAVGVLVFLWVVGAFNRLVRLRNEIGNAFAMIDVQLKRRHDLIPNLVEVARKYLEHERETLERVTAARAQAMAACDLVRAKPNDAGRLQSLSMAESSLAGALSRFQAVVEAYPDLKADGQLGELNEELRHTENKVAFARQYFNDVTLNYNNAAQQFPTNLVAGVFGFAPGAMLASTSSDAEREPVRVQF